MTDTTEKTITALNDLIETARDGEQGFRTAAQHVETPELRRLFETYADQRRDFAAELEAEVKRLGGAPARAASMLGSLYRGFLGVRSAVRPVGDDAILNECARGEESARQTYERALGEDLAPAVRPMIERQLARIVQAHERIRGLDRAA